MRRAHLRFASVLLVGLAAASAARAQSIETVSVADDGSLGDSHSYFPSVSDDGNRIVFQSLATNLVTGDGNAVSDVFLRDRAAGTTRRISVSSSGAEANGASSSPRISADGSVVIFVTEADNLVAGDDNYSWEIMCHDVATGITTRIAPTAWASQACRHPAVSGDGRYVAFASSAGDLVPDDLNSIEDVFVHDRTTGTTTRVSVDSNGDAANGQSFRPEISRDGRWVAYTSLASNLVAGDTNRTYDVFLHDLQLGTTTRISVGTTGQQAKAGCFTPAISDDGGIVAFVTSSNLDAADGNGHPDVYLRDVVARTTTPASVDSDGNFSSAPSNPGTGEPCISGDGRFVFFTSAAADLIDVDTNGVYDLFVRETALAVTLRDSFRFDGSQTEHGCYQPACSADGRFVVFGTGDADIAEDGDNPGFLSQLFLRDRRLDAASASAYGSGLAGTLGVPTLTASATPQLHADVDLQLGNSYGSATVGVLFLGFQRVQWPTSLGGDLLVAATTTLVLALPSGGAAIGGAVPVEELAVGIEVDAQLLVLDPGAIDGVAFSEGLALVLGY